jgi:hypothetical protein
MKCNAEGGQNASFTCVRVCDTAALQQALRNPQ